MFTGILLGLPCLGSGQLRADVVIDESFSADPKWETIGMDGAGGASSQFGWNSALQAIAMPGSAESDGRFLRRNGWDAYCKPLDKPLTEKQGFVLRGEVAMTSDIPYGRIYLGLFDRDASFAEERNAIYIERSKNPTQHYIKVYAVDDSGTEKFQSKFFGLGSDASSSKSVEIQYDPSAHTLSCVVDEQTDTITLPKNFHFSTNLCGASNARWSNSAVTYEATGQVDNILLEITP